MQWTEITVEGDMVGLFTQIPQTNEYIGWVCKGTEVVLADSSTDTEVTGIETVCDSYYVADF